MGLLRRKRRPVSSALATSALASSAQAVTQSASPKSAARVLLVNALLGLGGYAIRQLVIRSLAHGSAGPKDTPADAAGLAEEQTPASLPDRMATTVATAVATRSVPGAVLVGGVMGLRALYRRGKARRAARLGNSEGDAG